MATIIEYMATIIEYLLSNGIFMFSPPVADISVMLHQVQVTP